MKYRELIRRIKHVDGISSGRSAAMQFRHPTKPGTVTVPGWEKIGKRDPAGNT